MAAGRVQTPGRARNAAEPLGEKKGVSSRANVRKTGRESRRRAGPDGPDAAEAAAATTGKPEQDREQAAPASD